MIRDWGIPVANSIENKLHSIMNDKIGFPIFLLLPEKGWEFKEFELTLL